VILSIDIFEPELKRNKLSHSEAANARPLDPRKLLVHASCISVCPILTPKD
jgi:hypothetical protein